METQDPKRFKSEVGERIKTVRIANGFKTRADLSRHFPDWSEGRLANYENGTSLPSPIDIMRIAQRTGTNPCWIQFGRGAMYSREPDIHQIRRQNLARICSGLEAPSIKQLVRDLKLKPREFDHLLDDSNSQIGKSLCRRAERSLGLESGFMDRQHFDPSRTQPDMSPGLAELLAIYEALDDRTQRVLVNLARDLRDL